MIEQASTKGLLISIEGPDGSGKSTLIANLASHCQGRVDQEVILSREPGGEPIAESIRQIILKPENTQLDPRAEALLYAASRAQHLARKIVPALERGAIVFCDRYIDSSIAYQGYGRSLGALAISDINRYAVGTYMPDLTLYLRLDAQLGLARRHADSKDLNRLDQESLAFHERVVSGYEAIYRAQEAVHDKAKEARIVALDATQDPGTILLEAYAILQRRYPEVFH